MKIHPTKQLIIPTINIMNSGFDKIYFREYLLSNNHYHLIKRLLYPIHKKTQHMAGFLDLVNFY